MLTILTGAPGAGKTCAMVSLMSELAPNRLIFADGINGLTVDHVAIDARQWHVTVPDGGAIAVDEGQRLWRPRGPGQKVPADIEAMETHRHRGLDFFITTQHPKLLDGNIRNLCGRHVHIRDLGILGRWWYEWPEAADPGSWRTAPIKKRYRLDKQAFRLYTSSSLHVKPIRSYPWMLGVLAAAVLGVAVLSWMAWGAIKARMVPVHAPVPAVAPGAVPSAAAVPPGAVAGTVANRPSYLSNVLEFTPRYSAQPETAPAYDDLRRVVVFPQVAGGWCQGDECYCINQQGRNSGLSVRECRVWIQNPPFDPYRAPDRDHVESRRGDVRSAQFPGGKV